MSAEVKTDGMNRKARLARWIGGVAAPAALSAIVVLFAVQMFGYDAVADGFSGVCKELLVGSTQGRQALYGSCWHGPLFPLFHLPFAWLLPYRWAVAGTAFCAWFFLFRAIWHALKRFMRPEGGQLVALAPQIVLPVLALAIQPPVLAMVQVPLTAGLFLLAAAGVAEWAESRQVRSVVSAGIACALLLLCGASFFIPVILFLVSLPLLTLADAESRRRIQAWILLGWLPAIYAFGVWMLMNRLVLGDAWFFLRSIPPMVHGKRVWLLAGVPLLWLPAYLTTWLQAHSRSRRGSWMVVLLMAGLVSAALAFLFVVCGWKWPREPLLFCAYATLPVAICRGPKRALNDGMIYGVALLAVIAGIAVFPARTAKMIDGARCEPGTAERLCGEIESYVTEKSPYARVFVMGYDGLSLLRAYTGDRLTPNMDLHLFSLRQAYKGQHLFVLVPKPQGVAATESLFWRYPDIYTKGIDRLLFDRDFGEWRLYECVVAPTQEQLDAWRK